MKITSQNYMVAAMKIGMEHRSTLDAWKTNLTDIEVVMFIGLIAWLIIERDATPEVVSDSIPRQLASLPFEGCEQGWMQVIIDQLHQRGKTDEDIAALTRGMVSLITKTREIAERFEHNASTIETAA